jgi:hypothetical protein
MRTPIQLLALSINGAAYESAPKLKAKPAAALQRGR